jgi:hypothetical protein
MYHVHEVAVYIDLKLDQTEKLVSIFKKHGGLMKKLLCIISALMIALPMYAAGTGAGDEMGHGTGEGEVQMEENDTMGTEAGAGEDVDTAEDLEAEEDVGTGIGDDYEAEEDVETP